MAQFIHKDENITIGDGQVIIDIQVGNLQAGAIRVVNNGVVKARGATAAHGFLGQNEEAVGNLLVEVSTQDININATEIPLTITIRESGIVIFIQTYIATTTDGEVAMFEVKFNVAGQKNQHKNTKRNIVTILMFLLMSLTGTLLGQQRGLPADVTSNGLPGMIIIGVEPQSVTRPSTPGAFGVTLFPLVSEDGSLSNDFALETAPYWWKSHPTLTLNNYYSANRPSWQTIKSTTALSIATSAKDADTAGKSLGVGLRSQLLHGKMPYKTKVIMMAMTELNKIQVLIGIVMDDPTRTLNEVEDPSVLLGLFLNAYTNAIPADKPLIEEETFNFYIEDLLAKIPHATGESVTNYKGRLMVAVGSVYDKSPTEIDAGKPWGLIVEVNLACGMRFPNNEWNYSRVTAGGWMTATWRTQNEKFEITGMYRLLLTSINTTMVTHHDAGFSLMCRPISKFSATAEYVQRWSIYEARIKQDNRLSVIGHYKFNDDIQLTATLGKDFDGPYMLGGNLLTMLGVNYTFTGNNKLKK